MIGMNTSFGRSGAHDWWMQRASAILMLVYSIVLGFQLFNMSDVNYLTWTALFSETWMQVFTFVTVLSISAHAWVGLWIVSTDYIKPVAIRNLFQALVLIICLGIIVWTGMVFWS